LEELAVSSLIVLAAFRTVPLLLGFSGGGMSSASLAAFRSATVCLWFATSLCEISFNPRLGGLDSSADDDDSCVLVFGASHLVTVET
jgi:hypothetical protein